MDRPTQQIACATLLAALALFGCGGAKETEKNRSSSPGSELNAYEKDFRPAEHDMDLRRFFAELRGGSRHEPSPAVAQPDEQPVVVPGFRVQLLATSEIDEVNAKKALVETEFPEEWFYIAYDPPTYKLRAGNFLNRVDADDYARLMSEKGFPDAWVVPERVIKNAPPRNAPSSPDHQQRKQ
jgi:hypothetical protein